jgi:hypothetical protein
MRKYNKVNQADVPAPATLEFMQDMRTSVEVMKQKLDDICSDVADIKKKVEISVSWKVFVWIIAILSTLFSGVIGFQMAKISGVEIRAIQNSETTAVLHTQNEQILQVLSEVKTELRDKK